MDLKKLIFIASLVASGTTSKQLVKLIRDAGAREIHFRVTSPPVRHPCHYGMDFPSPDELIDVDLFQELPRSDDPFVDQRTAGVQSCKKLAAVPSIIDQVVLPPAEWLEESLDVVGGVA